MQSNTWSSSPHDNFVRALKKNDTDEVETTCRQLVVNTIGFLYEIYDAEMIPEEFEEVEYVREFVVELFTIPYGNIDMEKTETLNDTIDIEGLVEHLRLYVHFCRHHKSSCEFSRPCACHTSKECDTGNALGIGVGLLVKLGDFLRYEAMLLTTQWYRHMREFMRSPMNCSISRALGIDILACSDHYHCESRRPIGKTFPLDNVPCILLFYHIATGFEIPVSKIVPIRDFEAARQIVIATSLAKNRTCLLKIS